MNVHIRWLIRRDMPDVLAIDADSWIEPWGEEEFLRVLRRRNVIGMVAEDGDSIAGFMVYELNKQSLGLLHLAVRRDLRRRGVGRKLIGRIQAKIDPHRRSQVVLTVPDRPLGLHLFLKAVGFEAVEVLGWDRDEYLFQMKTGRPLPA